MDERWSKGRYVHSNTLEAEIDVEEIKKEQDVGGEQGGGGGGGGYYVFGKRALEGFMELGLGFIERGLGWVL